MDAPETACTFGSTRSPAAAFGLAADPVSSLVSAAAVRRVSGDSARVWESGIRRAAVRQTAVRYLKGRMGASESDLEKRIEFPILSVTRLFVPPVCSQSAPGRKSGRYSFCRLSGRQKAAGLRNRRLYKSRSVSDYLAAASRTLESSASQAVTDSAGPTVMRYRISSWSTSWPTRKVRV